MRPTSHDEIGLVTEDLLFDTEKSSGMNVEFRNVSFKYPTRDVAVLKNLNMTVSGPGIFLKKSSPDLMIQIEEGQFAAIVGSSGICSSKLDDVQVLNKYRLRQNQYNIVAGTLLYTSNGPDLFRQPRHIQSPTLLLQIQHLARGTRTILVLWYHTRKHYVRNPILGAFLVHYMHK
jgi:ABC-type transport system involved in cytochrome bd biosynthesis fused ATPase/permease subunit